MTKAAIMEAIEAMEAVEAVEVAKAVEAAEKNSRALIDAPYATAQGVCLRFGNFPLCACVCMSLLCVLAGVCPGSFIVQKTHSA